MSAITNQRPAYYARLICEHMKRLPNYYAGSLDEVKEHLGISDAAFKMGLDWCVARKIIVLETKSPVSTFNSDVEQEALQGEKSRLTSMLRSPALAEAS